MKHNSSRTATTSAPERSNTRTMFLVGAMLLICVVWLTYSRWSNDSVEAPEVADTVHSSNPFRVASGNSTSTPSTHTSADVSGSSHAADTRAASKNETPTTYDDRLEHRVTPVEDFARRGDPKAIPAVLDALQDDDWRVRSRVMDAAVNAYVPIPESALIDRAQSDPSAEVRFLALAGIAARIEPAISRVPAIDADTARSLGRLALSDSSEEVRWQAQQILDALDAHTTAPTEDQSQGGAL